jgi:hypothetical protein
LSSAVSPASTWTVRSTDPSTANEQPVRAGGQNNNHRRWAERTVDDHLRLVLGRGDDETAAAAGKTIGGGAAGVAAAAAATVSSDGSIANRSARLSVAASPTQWTQARRRA